MSTLSHRRIAQLWENLILVNNFLCSPTWPLRRLWHIRGIHHDRVVLATRSADDPSRTSTGTRVPAPAQLHWPAFPSFTPCRYISPPHPGIELKEAYQCTNQACCLSFFSPFPPRRFDWWQENPGWLSRAPSQFFLLVPSKIQAKLVWYLDGGSILAPVFNTLHYPFGNWGNRARALINRSQSRVVDGETGYPRFFFC